MLDFFGQIFTFIGTPLYYAISAVMVAFHTFFSQVLGFDPAGGAAWALSIIGLTLRCGRRHRPVDPDLESGVEQVDHEGP